MSSRDASTSLRSVILPVPKDRWGQSDDRAVEEEEVGLLSHASSISMGCREQMRQSAKVKKEVGYVPL